MNYPEEKCKEISMKNILLATDFSSNAYKAAVCAGEIAVNAGGRLIIFYALPPFLMALDGTKKTESEEVVQNKMDTLAFDLHNKFQISVSRLIKPGFAEDEILAFAQKLKTDLIVLGAKGEDHQKNKVLGHIALAIWTKSIFPVVCVPSNNYKNFASHLDNILKYKEQLCNIEGLKILTGLKSQLA